MNIDITSEIPKVPCQKLHSIHCKGQGGGEIQSNSFEALRAFFEGFLGAAGNCGPEGSYTLIERQVPCLY